MSKMTPNDYSIEGIGHLLKTIEGGAFYERLNDDAINMVKALDWHVERFGGEPSGEITIKIKYTAQAGSKAIHADYSVKEPKRPRAKAVFWSKADGSLTMVNPDQMAMSFPSIITIDGKKAD